MTLPLTLAGAWHKKGVAAISRSFRFHRPRGAFCHRGWCQQCRTQLPDGRIVLACRVPADEHAHPVPTSHDALRPIGAIAERTRPWFYERQTLTGMLQQAFVKTLRRLSGAPSLPPSTDRNVPARRATATRTCEILVIGGGPAGLAAARELARAGRNCIVVQAGAAGGTARAVRDPATKNTVDTPPGCEILEHHLCVGLYDDARGALCIGPQGNTSVQFQALVVATGAYDRLPTVPGNDIPGVVGLRAFERLAAQGALRVDSRIGVYANSSEANRALEVVRRAGVPLAFIAGPADLPATTGLRVSQARLARIKGRKRVSGIVLEDGTRAPCDILVVGITQPSYELQAQNGCAVELRGDPPVVLPTGRPLARMLVVGEAAGWIDPSDVEARTRDAVRAWLANQLVAEEERTGTKPATTIDDRAFVCLCEDVRAGDIRAALDDGYGDVELVKRHTGAGTGPCQGKLCHGSLLACAMAHGAEVRIPTPRPLVRPVSIAELVAGDNATP